MGFTMGPAWQALSAAVIEVGRKCLLFAEMILRRERLARDNAHSPGDAFFRDSYVTDPKWNLVICRKIPFRA